MTLLAKLERWWHRDEYVLTVERKGSLPRRIPFKVGERFSFKALAGGGKGPVTIRVGPKLS